MSLQAVFRAYGRHKILRYREYFPRKKCYNWQKNMRKLNCLPKQFSLQYFWSTIMNNDSIMKLQLALSCQLHVLKDIDGSFTHLKSVITTTFIFNNFRVPITNGWLGKWYHWQEIFVINFSITSEQCFIIFSVSECTMNWQEIIVINFNLWTMYIIFCYLHKCFIILSVSEWYRRSYI